MTAPAQAPGPTPCGTFDLNCHAGQLVTSTAESALGAMINSAAQGAAELVVDASTWWVRTDSVNPQDSAVLVAQGATGSLTAVILVGSVLVQAIRLMFSRKAEPLMMVASGLVRFAVVSALGLTVLQAALKEGDEIAAGLLDGAAGNFALLMRDLLLHQPKGTFAVLLCSIIAALLAIVQWVLMAIRQVGLLVLAAMLPLAASGSINRSTRGWLDRLLAWLLAIVAYKPAAALIYYIGFTYLSSPASNQSGGIGTLLSGLMVLTLAVIAMPVMLKFFSWGGIAVTGGGGGGSGVINAAGAAAMSQGYARSAAVSRAAAINATGPGSAATPAAGGAGAAGAAMSSATGAAAAAGPVGAATAAVTLGAAAVRGTGQRMAQPPEDGGPS